MIRHLKQYHADTRAFKCLICDKDYKWIDSLHKHMKMHKLQAQKQQEFENQQQQQQQQQQILASTSSCVPQSNIVVEELIEETKYDSQLVV